MDLGRENDLFHLITQRYSEQEVTATFERYHLTPMDLSFLAVLVLLDLVIRGKMGDDL